MLKFKKDGKEVGVLKDNASEPEGEAFKFKDSIDDDDTKPASPKEAEAQEEE